jgi:hypothetical protein
MTLWGLLARGLSLLLAILYSVFIVMAMLHTYPVPAEAALRSAEWCALAFVAVALIWFSEPIASATGFLGGASGETPPGFIAFMGWVFLVGLPLVIWLIYRA